jgi:hypothetical protein
MADPIRGCEHGGHVRCRACCDADYERRIAALEAEVAKARAEEREAIVGMLHRERDAVLLDAAHKHNTAAVLLDIMGRIEHSAQDASDE